MDENYYYCDITIFKILKDSNLQPAVSIRVGHTVLDRVGNLTFNTEYASVTSLLTIISIPSDHSNSKSKQIMHLTIQCKSQKQ